MNRETTMDLVLHLFRWHIMQFVAQPFTPEYLFLVHMDKKLCGDDTFNPHRVLFHLYFRRFLQHHIVKQKKNES